ncbi:MAG: hypothetical protein IT175_02740 [Acidobacteria bacterium]|nr:hypothetical protein [Acidobacteriota bacterium]
MEGTGNAIVVSPASAATGEVAAKAAELIELQARLTDRNEYLVALRAEIVAFETRYLRAVRSRYVELDRLEAGILAAMSAMSPEDAELAERAEAARLRAERSAAEYGEDFPEADVSSCHTPSTGLKRLFRRIAFEMHPDRADDEDEAAFRHELMIEANRAYRDGDHGLLQSLLADVDVGAEAGSDLARLLRRIAVGERRLADVEREIEALERSEFHDLWREALDAARQGRDLVAEKLAELDRKIRKQQSRLDLLQHVA